MPSRACARGAGPVERFARWCFRVHRGVLVLQSPLFSTIVPHCGVTTRCTSLHETPPPDAPKRIRSRRPFSRCLPAAFPGADSATGSASFWATTIWPVRQGSIDGPWAPRRLGSGHSPGARCRRIPRFRRRHRAANRMSCWANQREHVHRRAERFGFRVLHRRPCRRVRAALRASTPRFTRVPRAHSTSASLGPRSSERDRASIGTRPLGRRPSGHRRPVRSFAATPKRRGSRVRRMAVRARQVTRPGAMPWSGVPGMHALRSRLFLCTEARRIERFLGDKTAGRSRPGAGISFHAEACRDPRLPFGSAPQGPLSPPRRDVLVRAFPLGHDRGPSASGSAVRSVEASWIEESPTEQLSEAAFSSVQALQSGHSLRAGLLDRPPRGVELASVPKH